MIRVGAGLEPAPTHPYGRCMYPFTLPYEVSYPLFPVSFPLPPLIPTAPEVPLAS